MRTKHRIPTFFPNPHRLPSTGETRKAVSRRAKRERAATSASNTSTTDATSDMAPRAKRRRVAAPKFLCYSCASEKTGKAFPDVNPSAECGHLIHTCKMCLKQWVAARVEGDGFVRKVGGDVGVGGDEEEGEVGAKEDIAEEKVEGERKGDVNQEGGGVPEGLLFGIPCPHPGCEAVMRNVNVKMATTKAVHKRFEELERKFIGDSTPNWRWCLHPGCKAGQVHIPLIATEAAAVPEASTTKQPKKGRSKKKEPIQIYEDPVTIEPTSPDICTCTTCGARACVPCDRPLHEGETCAAFQARTKDRIKEEDQALTAIRKVTKPCPGCSKRIQKDGGCPAMICSQCRTTFCWNCVQRFVNGYCKCHPAPVPLHVVNEPLGGGIPAMQTEVGRA